MDVWILLVVVRIVVDNHVIIVHSILLQVEVLAILVHVHIRIVVDMVSVMDVLVDGVILREKVDFLHILRKGDSEI